MAAREAPISIHHRLGQRLEIEWEDGHVSSFTMAQLRAACPCEQCEAGRGVRVLPYAPQSLRSHFWTPKVVRWLLWAGWAVSLIAWGLLFVEVESVVVTGPVLAFVGLLTIIAALFARYRLAILPAVGHWLICLLFMGLVAALNWSPGDAEVPFLTMGAVYVAGTFPLAWWVQTRAPAVHVPGQCDHCGYLLFGLGAAADARCPECGTPFNPAELGDLPAPAAGVTGVSLEATRVPQG